MAGLTFRFPFSLRGLGAILAADRAIRTGQVQSM